MSTYYELDPLSFDELIARFHSPPPDGNEYEFVYYSEVAELIIAKGDQAGIDFLRSELDRARLDKLRAILSTLAPLLLNDPAFKMRLVLLLNDDYPFLVMEAIDCLSLQDDKTVLDTVRALSTHASPYVRGAVLRYVRQVFPYLSLPLLIEGAGDEHYIVRESAADELGELGDPSALPHLQILLTDPHPDVQEAARTAIEWLQSS